MSGGDGKPKQQSKPAAPPPRTSTGSVSKPGGVSPTNATKPSIPRTASRPGGGGGSDSSFDLPTIGSGKSSMPSLPRVPTAPSMKAASAPAANPWGDEERTAAASHRDLQRVTGASASSLPTVPTGATTVPMRKPSVIAKQLASSGFDQQENTQLEAVMGRTKSIEFDADEVQEPASGEFYDGETPAAAVSTKSTWRALKAPVKSNAKRRNPRTLWTVIDQFAVGNNPRYAVTSPAAEPRAHVFAWDVSMAMECEIPHYRHGREMTLAQTLDWLRLEAQYKGWKKSLDHGGAIDAADRGELVFVVPKDVKARALGIVRPGGGGDDGLPRVASAGRPRGNDLGLVEAIGSNEVVYFTHP